MTDRDKILQCLAEHKKAELDISPKIFKAIIPVEKSDYASGGFEKVKVDAGIIKARVKDIPIGTVSTKLSMLSVLFDENMKALIDEVIEVKKSHYKGFYYNRQALWDEDWLNFVEGYYQMSNCRCVIEPVDIQEYEIDFTFAYDISLDRRIAKTNKVSAFSLQEAKDKIKKSYPNVKFNKDI